MKNFISKVFMAIVACLFCMQTAQAADTWSYPSEEPDGKFGGGSGTASSPYLINSAQQLADLAWLVRDGEEFTGKYFKLTTDITLNDITWNDDHTPANSDDLKIWKPIGKHGSFLNDYFEGYFDGGGHTISGLALKVSDNKYTGLFGATRDAVISNLTIKDCYMFTPDYVVDGVVGGMLVAYMRQSQMVNCHVNGNVNVFLDFDASYNFSRPVIGGVVGQGSGDGKSMTSCSFDGYIHVREGRSYMAVAGLMAEGSPTLTGCKVSGTMEITLTPTNFVNEAGTIDMFCSGLCYEAENITGCLSTMNFLINADGLRNNRHGYLKNFRLYGLCNNAKNIKQSAYMGRIDLKTAMSFFYSKSCIGTVGTVSNSISDCSIYCTVDATETVLDESKGNQSHNPKITYYPFLTEKAKSVNNVVVRYGDDFKTFDEKYICQERPFITGEEGYVTDKSNLSDVELLNRLNSQETISLLWGKVGSGEYANCPLPMACGAQTYFRGLKGNGTENNPYLIGSKSDLFAFASLVNGGMETEGQHFALTTNLDMTGSETLDAIGDTEHPFRGTFNGRGYAISNIKLNDGLFGYLEGTLKNLTVIGAELTQENQYSGVLANCINSIDGYSGTITNCYAGGDITINKCETTYSDAYIGGLCGCGDAGNISDCYFKGHIHVNDDSNKKLYFIGGLVGVMNDITVNGCYASFEADDDIRFSVAGIAGDRREKGDKSLLGVIKNSYYVCDKATGYYNAGYKAEKLADENVERCDNDGDICNKTYFSDNTNWAKGAYRPVLRNTRCYAATAADGSYTKAYFDAIPMADSKNTSNDIFHFDGTGYENDNMLWALPNLAIYNQADTSDYILNCTLDPAKPLNYNNKVNTTVKAVKVNMHYPLALTTGKNYYPLCLPGTVQRGDFPFGSLLYIGGEVKDDSDGSRYINIVQADSVAAGVPFVAYIPSPKTGETIDIVIRSRMAPTPLKSITDGTNTQNFALTGTYKDVAASDVCTNFVEKGSKLYLNKVEGKQTMAPFTAYLESEQDVELRNYILLDETSNDIADVIADNDGKNVKTMLKRTLVKDKWNTICLPTKMSSYYIEYMFGTGTKLECLSAVETAADGGCTLVFTSATDIEAGKSYLIKPANDNVVYNLGYCDISGTLTSSDFSVTIDGTPTMIKFCGTFERKMLGVDESGDDNEEEYFTQDNKIYHVGDGHTVAMNGFRCYITANEAAASALAKARMVHGDGSTTTLRLVEVGSTADGKQRVYDLQGIEQNANNAQQRGVYIKGGHKYVK